MCRMRWVAGCYLMSPLLVHGTRGVQSFSCELQPLLLFPPILAFESGTMATKICCIGGCGARVGWSLALLWALAPAPRPPGAPEILLGSMARRYGP